jgi:hypothetical protein
MKKVVILVLLMVTSVTFAQETKKQSKWVIGIGANFIDNTTTIDNNFVDVSNWNATMGASKISAQYFYNTKFSVSSEFSLNRLDKDVMQNGETIATNMAYFGVDLNARYNVASWFKLPSKYALEPIVGVGASWTDSTPNQSVNTGLSVGYQINALYGIRLQTLGKFASEQNTVGNNMIQHSVELYFNL